MGLKIITGAAGSGKTERMIKEMAERAASLSEERFFVIAPEQATLNMQRDVVRHIPGGATLNIDVVSFDRLAHVVFADLGIEASNLLDDTGKVLMLRQVLEEVKDDLSVYKSKVHLPGFAQRIKSAVTELKQYGIDDNTLYLMQESAESKNNRLLYAKLEDLRLISRHFDEKIKDAYRATEEVLALFASSVKDSARIRDSHIYLDGFTGFTPVQCRLLAEFFRYAADVTVTVTISRERIRKDCPEYDLFHLSNETYFKLVGLAKEAGIPVLDEHTDLPGKEELSCRIYPAPDMKGEVLYAAKEILRLVRDEGLRYREIAVIVSDMEAYHKTAENVFEEAGIPCFIDHKSTIAEHPLSRYLLAALSLFEQRFSYESVFSWLKTGLTDLSLQDISILENYCLEFGIRGIRAWHGEMTKNRKLYGVEPTEAELAEDPCAGMAWDLSEINRIRQCVMDSVLPFYKAISKKNLAAADYVKALTGLLRKNHIRERIGEMTEKLGAEGRLKEQREYAQVYDLIVGLLEKTRLLSGEKELSVRDYRMILESGLSEIKIGIIPPTIDTLTVGDLTRTRLEHIRVLFLLGVNNGKIPSASEPSGVLSARDRDFLKAERFELAPTSTENMYHQRFYLYLMLHKPADKLYMTYAATGPDGEELEPSYILEEIPELIPAARMEQVTELPGIRWRKQAIRELALQMRGVPEESMLRFFAKEEPEVLKQLVDAAFYTNRQTPLDKQVALDLYGDVLSGSVSRYEKYSECPFKHFLTYGIRLEKRPEYEIAATDVGTIYHSVLELYSQKLDEEGFSYRDVPDEESRRIAKECVSETIETMQSDILDSSARNEFFVKRITDVAVKTTDVLREQVKAGRFEPDAYELEFKQSLNEHVRFKGKIDRVDIYDADDIYIKIIDYKSGNKQFKAADIYSGLQLQLVAYLKEAIGHYEEEYPGRNVRPGGVYYYRINDSFGKNDKEVKERFKLSGLTSCEEGLVQAMDENLAPGLSSDSMIIPVKYTKNGDFSSGSLVANPEEFRHLMDFVGEKIESISEKILDGDITIAPHYEQERNNACVYCDYRDVCKFEAGCFGTDWNRKEDISTAEMEAEIYGRVYPE